MEKPVIKDIHMPSNTSMGFYIGIFSFLFGFGIIWHIFWLAGFSAVAMITCVIIRLSEKDTEYTVTAQEIETIERRMAT